MDADRNEIHSETDAARAGSTPNIVRWILLVSLFAAIALLSIIWMTGAAVTDGADDTNNATDRMAQEADQLPGNTTDSIVSDRPELIAGPETTPSPDTPAADVPEASPTPE